jgi:flavin-dependent dehydrogenase
MNPPQSATDVASCDVFVLGGGPAGATVSTLLARRGFDVVMVDKDRHPRFHIGESLLPLNLPLFEQLGVREQIERIAIVKYGAEFNSLQHDHAVTFYFSEAWDKAHPYAYEVRRAEFDEILFRNAVATGARAFEECRVTGIEFREEEGVEVSAREANGAPRRWRARFVVDASGRDTFLATKFGIKRRNSKHNSAAIYAHFAGAKRLPGRDEGNISIFWFEHGWIWFIPLRDGITSIGAVCWPYYLQARKTDSETFLLETLRMSPQLADRLKDARLASSVTATGNYSYVAERMAGDRYLIVGDAYAFVDPVFSSGVMLAMNGAFLAAEAVDTWFRDPRQAAPIVRRFEAAVLHGLRNFSWFIYRMTNPSIRELFMAPRNMLRMQEALVSLLAGDLFRSTPIYRSLAAFKVVYYLTCLCSPLRTLRAWRRRKQAIRDVQADAPAPQES